MSEFRLEVFLAVARLCSFTKAASEMLVSQPAISKQIKELEREYGVQLFVRMNNRVSLTKEGEIFRGYAERISQTYRELKGEMNQCVGRISGTLSIGASTTAAQYILPQVISQFKEQNPDIEISLITGNSEYIESLVTNNIVRLGIVEGITHKKEFHYSHLLHDELVLIRSTSGDGREEVSIEDLKSIPLVVRERGSGTLEVIGRRLREQGISPSSLNIVMRLGSSEAIKRYVLAGSCYAIISVAAIVDELRAGTLSIVDIEGLKIEREFSFIQESGSQDRLSELFTNFAITKSYR